MRCTQATLEALGVFGKCPQFGTGVLQALKEAGKTIRMIDTTNDKGQTIGLRSFVESHPHGKFYLASEGHAMALVDGVLTDTSERKLTDRIKVWAAVMVFDA